MSENDFNVFVGAQTGILKGVNLNRKQNITKNFGLKSSLSERRGEITSLSWEDQNFEGDIMVGFQNKKICFFDTGGMRYRSSRDFEFGNGDLVSAFQLSGSTIVGLNSGEVMIECGDESTVLKTSRPLNGGIKRKGPSLSCVKPNSCNPSEIATGGCENDLQVWNMKETATPTFRAKNIQDDMLSLRVPIWISDISYLPNSNLVATSSRHRQVRLYDPNAQRKPVIHFEWEDNPLTCITAVPSAERQIIVGANHGRMALFDFRKVKAKSKANAVVTYKDFAGGVKDVVVHKSMPLVFSVSVDRFLRVHHLHKMKVIHKQFLNSRLNCLLIREELKEKDFQLTQNSDAIKKGR